MQDKPMNKKNHDNLQQIKSLQYASEISDTLLPSTLSSHQLPHQMSLPSILPPSLSPNRKSTLNMGGSSSSSSSTYVPSHANNIYAPYVDIAGLHKKEGIEITPPPTPARKNSLSEVSKNLVVRQNFASISTVDSLESFIEEKSAEQNKPINDNPPITSNHQTNIQHENFNEMCCWKGPLVTSESSMGKPMARAGRALLGLDNKPPSSSYDTPSSSVTPKAINKQLVMNKDEFAKL